MDRIEEFQQCDETEPSLGVPPESDVAFDHAIQALENFCASVHQPCADTNLVAYLATYPKLLQDHVDACARLRAAQSSTILRGITPILCKRIHLTKRALSQYESFVVLLLQQPRFNPPMPIPSSPLEAVKPPPPQYHPVHPVHAPPTALGDSKTASSSSPVPTTPLAQASPTTHQRCLHRKKPQRSSIRRGLPCLGRAPASGAASLHIHTSCTRCKLFPASVHSCAHPRDLLQAHPIARLLLCSP